MGTPPYDETNPFIIKIRAMAKGIAMGDRIDHGVRGAIDFLNGVRADMPAITRPVGSGKGSGSGGGKGSGNGNGGDAGSGRESRDNGGGSASGRPAGGGGVASNGTAAARFDTDVTLEEVQPKCQTTKAARLPECLDTPQETWVKGSWTKALCWTCGKRGKFKCVGCWMGRYCDKTCQKEGWRHDGHKAECDGLGKRKTKRREAKKLARAERTADQQMASSGGGGGGLKSQPL